MKMHIEFEHFGDEVNLHINDFRFYRNPNFQNGKRRFTPYNKLYCAFKINGYGIFVSSIDKIVLFESIVAFHFAEGNRFTHVIFVEDPASSNGINILESRTVYNDDIVAIELGKSRAFAKKDTYEIFM